MYDLKVINAVLSQLEEERGIPREKVLEAIELALATAYKKEYGKRGHIIRAAFNADTGNVDFFQVKIVVDPSAVVETKEEKDAHDEAHEGEEGSEVVVFNDEHHILIDDAKKIKAGAEPEDEITFPLEVKQDFGRIAAQTAKQVVMQKIREAEKVSVLGEFSQREGDIVTGTVQRIERGNIFVDLGRATGLLLRDEQIPGERFRQGERVRALLLHVDESPRGVFLKLTRSHPQFLQKLFENEAPELTSGAVSVKAIAREAGSRTKIAVYAEDQSIDPVGALVGQRGVRVSTVMSELGGEKIDIIEWSEKEEEFIEDAMSPAQVLEVQTNEEDHLAVVEVAADQQSLAIGKGGQNVRLAAKLTGWRIDVQSTEGEAIAEADADGEVEVHETDGTDDITPAEDLGETVGEVTADNAEAETTPDNTEETTEAPAEPETPEETEEAVDEFAEITEESADDTEENGDANDDEKTKKDA